MESIGLHIDGQILKLAYVRKIKNNIQILALESLVLPARDKIEELENSQIEETSGFEQDQDKENAAFGKAKRESVDENATLDLITGLLQKYPLNKASIGLSVPASSVHYSPITISEHVKGRRLKKDLAEKSTEISITLNKNTEKWEDGDPHFVKIGGDNYLMINHSGNNFLLDQILSIKSAGLIDKKSTISLITTQEVAIAILAGLYSGSESVLSKIVVLFGKKSSKILYMQGTVLSSVSVTFDPGSIEYKTVFLDKVYAKILMVLDQMNIHEPDEIYLAGEVSIHREDQRLFCDYFDDKFPESTCKILPDAGSAIDTDLLEDEQKPDVSSFAVPIGLAIGTTLKSGKTYDNSNFLPKALKKEQSSHRLSWHGYAAMFMLFFSSIYYTFQWFSYADMSEKAERSLMLLEESLNSEQEIAGEIALLEEKTGLYRKYISLTDSLWHPGPLYSETLLFLAQSSKELNSLWINKLSINDINFQLSGSSLYRNRINRFAETTGNAMINSVSEENIREGKVYNFDIKGNPRSFITPVLTMVHYIDSVSVETGLVSLFSKPAFGKEK